MTAPLLAPCRQPREVESNVLADLALIYEPDIDLCVVNRSLKPSALQFVRNLIEGHWTFETHLTIERGRPSYERLLPDEIHAVPGADNWLIDVETLVHVVRDLFDPDGLGLRLRVLDHAMCPRFHVDSVVARLVCTYGGLGTEWLPNEAADRTKLGQGSGGLPDAESGLILDSHAMRSIPCFAVAVLKGNQWAGNGNYGAIHRSPTLTVNHPRRLLLTIDPYWNSHREVTE